ncbi:hypothetical protein ON010_g4547 [Phytophthora cinnamomi]|nr:hypothetical protein ON010_g4547 [Phytophthora cinnamomi]
MAYCGSVGSVNVLAIMSSDLFDESQENPFLIQQRSPSPTKQKLDSARAPQRAVSFIKGGELPLGDPSGYRDQFGATSPLKSSSQSAPVSPQYSPGRTVSFAAPGSVPRGILKRLSSYESDASTVPSIRDQQQPMNSLGTDSELHKLLYSLNRFGLANDAGGANSPGSSPQDLPLESNPLWFRKNGGSTGGQFDPVVEGPESGDEFDERRASRTSMTKRRRSSKKKSCVLRQDPMGRSRGSVTFATVKNLLRGGGLAGRTALKNTPEAQRKKSMGTISSRMKIKQKFVRPTILTDAYHRVSDMKLGTRPLSVCIKHVAFPERWEDDLCDREEADPGMPPPKGQLKRSSFITLETLDKIGTRAACPVHLIEEEKPDYSRVSARVDSYNHIRSPKRGLRRPSTWLAGAALDALNNATLRLVGHLPDYQQLIKQAAHFIRGLDACSLDSARGDLAAFIISSYGTAGSCASVESLTKPPGSSSVVTGCASLSRIRSCLLDDRLLLLHPVLPTTVTVAVLTFTVRHAHTVALRPLGAAARVATTTTAAVRTAEAVTLRALGTPLHTATNTTTVGLAHSARLSRLHATVNRAALATSVGNAQTTALAGTRAALDAAAATSSVRFAQSSRARQVLAAFSRAHFPPLALRSRASCRRTGNSHGRHTAERCRRCEHLGLTLSVVRVGAADTFFASTQRPCRECRRSTGPASSNHGTRTRCPRAAGEAPASSRTPSSSGAAVGHGRPAAGWAAARPAAAACPCCWCPWAWGCPC